MYAIAFDLVIDDLRTHYSATSPNNAYTEVRRILEEDGFAWRQGSVYFGDPARVNAVSCVLTAQRLANELPWFSTCVRDVRMLRIEENNDLFPAVSASPRSGGGAGA
ncbi:MAG: virulence factor [Candidatus Eremiobacteraeota bacterium]|nr:virulence factor [Candidatus Eremiobacteraeota bacterium]